MKPFKCFEKSQLNLKYEDCNPVGFQNYIKTYRKNLDNKKFLEKKKQTHILKANLFFNRIS